MRSSLAAVLLSAGLWAQKPQPIPFSHKVHAALGQKCAGCHTMPAPGDLATYPAESRCMACHEAIRADSPAVRKLAEFNSQGKRVPWVRVYKVPGYVYFSHQSHHKKAGIACETCHGPVAERDVIVKEKPIHMKACMDCHDRMKASNECNFCHAP